MPNPTPIRQRIRTFLTPDIRDFIVAESKDVSYKEIPAYGTAHPNTTKYPNHKFAFPQPADDQGLMYTLLYVMERAEQDKYNWEMQDAGVSETKFLQVQRTYVTLRSSFSSTTPAMGASMPNVPSGKFSGAFVLADRQQRRSQDKELDTLFVVDVHTYIQKEILTDVEPDPQSGIANPITTTLYYRGENITSGAVTKTVQEWFADPTSTYWATDSVGYGRTGKQLTDNWFAVSYGKIVDLDTMWEKESNRLRPDKYYCPKQIRKNTTITANNTPGEPSDPTAALGSSVTIGKVGRIEKVTTVEQTGSPQVLKSLELLPDDGYIYPASEELVSAAAVPSVRSYINGEGQAITFNNIEACNAAKLTRQAVSLEDAYLKSVQRFVPDKFILDASTKTLEETETGVSGEPGTPVAENRTRITVKQKGVIRSTETVEQLGTLTDLKGLSTLDDGFAYPFTQKVVALSAVPALRQGIAVDGTIKEHTPVDANWAVEETKQAVSLEPEYQKQSSRMAPDRFLAINQKSTTETTTTGVLTVPSNPSVPLQSETTVVQKGRIRKTSTTEQLGSLQPIYGTSVDKRTGETFIETTEVVPASTVIASEIASDGTVVIYEPVDANWSLKITRRAASTLTKTWTTDIDYEWPTVLLGISFKVWAHKSGGSAVYPVPRYKKGFYEPQTATVTQYWQKAQPVIVPRPLMVAEGFTYRCPQYSISVPACLHQTIVLSCFIGSSDPDWESASDTETFAATRYTDWPENLFWRLAEPYLGGFLVTEYTLPRPV